MTDEQSKPTEDGPTEEWRDRFDELTRDWVMELVVWRGDRKFTCVRRVQDCEMLDSRLYIGEAIRESMRAEVQRKIYAAFRNEPAHGVGTGAKDE